MIESSNAIPVHKKKALHFHMLCVNFRVAHFLHLAMCIILAHNFFALSFLISRLLFAFEIRVWFHFMAFFCSFVARVLIFIRIICFPPRKNQPLNIEHWFIFLFLFCFFLFFFSSMMFYLNLFSFSFRPFISTRCNHCCTAILKLLHFDFYFPFLKRFAKKIWTNEVPTVNYKCFKLKCSAIFTLNAEWIILFSFGGKHYAGPAGRV